jgi:DNA adenine methylase
VTTEMKITAIAPWFGAARMIAKHVGKALKGCNWVAVPFAGGMPELAQIPARTIMVSDLHRHVINLARVASHADAGPILYRRCRRKMFDPSELAQAQAWCKLNHPTPEVSDIDAAEKYFVACWMGRSAKSGIDDEFNGGLSFRWNSNGGDSVVRYRNAVQSLLAFRRIAARCQFTVMDAFMVLDRCEDRQGHGIYADAPWPDDGDRYKHPFTEADQRRLAEALGRFQHTRIVIRYGDHPLIRELYPVSRWNWQLIEGRTQGNNAKAEVLITRKDSK